MTGAAAKGATPTASPPLQTADRAVVDALPLRDGRRLAFDRRPRIAGIVNITPDSFSDGGRWLEPELAVEHALHLVASGAEVIDLGAESTRPGGGVYGGGAVEVDPDRELERLLPVLEPLRAATAAVLSVDTRKAQVAMAALDAGADLINDVSALGDPDMAAVIADSGAPIILMHSRGDLATMQRRIDYDDVVEDVTTDLEDACRRALAAGIDARQLVLDPGIGFGKTAEHNLRLLRELPALRRLGRPLMVGASRKSFIGAIAGSEVADRLPGSLAAAAWAAHHGAELLRVHDVAATRQFLDVWSAIERGRASGRGTER